MKRPLFIVVSAPSGCGKTTLINLLREKHPDIQFSISCTTRAPRGAERDGVEYHFRTKERFEELIREDAFVEYARVHDNYYGTLKEPIREALAAGHSIILDIDVQGAEKVREFVRGLGDGDSLKTGFADLFINPPSIAELRRRLEGRGTDSRESIERRLANAAGEMARAHEYKYNITNDVLAVASRELCDLYERLSE